MKLQIVLLFLFVLTIACGAPNTHDFHQTPCSNYHPSPQTHAQCWLDWADPYKGAKLLDLNQCRVEYGDTRCVAVYQHPTCDQRLIDTVNDSLEGRMYGTVRVYEFECVVADRVD